MVEFYNNIGKGLICNPSRVGLGTDGRGGVLKTGGGGGMGHVYIFRSRVSQKVRKKN